MEKKDTGKIPSMFMNKMVRAVSTNPRPNMGMANAPTANVDTTMLADSHFAALEWTSLASRRREIAWTYYGADLAHARISSFVARDPLGAPLFNTELASKPLKPGV